MIYSVKGIALLALTLGVGYLVLIAAAKEKDMWKTIGYVIGIALIVAVIIGAVLPIIKVGGSGIPVCGPR